MTRPASRHRQEQARHVVQRRRSGAGARVPRPRLLPARDPGRPPSALRDELGQRFDVRLGRWHDQPIGPHTRGMYQVLFAAELVRAARAVADAQPRPARRAGPSRSTGDDLADHTAHALWLGEQAAAAPRGTRRPLRTHRMSTPDSLTPRPIDPGTRIGHVHLKVADLDRALAFYCGVLGFELTQRYGRAGRLRLGRRLPPPYRPQHLGKPRRPAAAPRAPPACSTWPFSTRPAPPWPTRCAG